MEPTADTGRTAWGLDWRSLVFTKHQFLWQHLPVVVCYLAVLTWIYDDCKGVGRRRFHFLYRVIVGFRDLCLLGTLVLALLTVDWRSLVSRYSLNYFIQLHPPPHTFTTLPPTSAYLPKNDSTPLSFIK